jgi:putative hydrolase of the HAD superfamily
MNARKNISVFWVSDADNTLWDTDAVYRTAQTQLLTEVEMKVGITSQRPDRLGYLRSVDQALARLDHRGLRYPTTMLISALASNLRGVSVNDSVKKALLGISHINQSEADLIACHFEEAVNKLPSLRPGVKKGLSLLQTIGAEVLILTEGPQDRINATLNKWGLTPLVDSVLSAKKSPLLFKRLAMSKPNAKRWAIGDQLDRDVLPAIGAGFEAIYFPGGFKPNWADISPSNSLNYVVTESYLTAVNHALAIS